MKHGKRLTVAMKKLMADNGYDYKDYLYIKNTERTLIVVHRITGKKILLEW